MSRSNAEELIGVLWFILATQLHDPWLKGIALFWGAFAIVSSLILATANLFATPPDQEGRETK